MNHRQTIGRMLAEINAENIAFKAPDRIPMTYGVLCDLICKIGGDLRLAGITANARVAIVLPNGPEAATAFLAVSNCATAAPLNPSYTQDEFAFYMEDLEVKLLICADADGTAAAAAKSLNIPVAIADVRNSEPAGFFQLDIESGVPVSLTESDAADTCLVLHTSGTTSRPKIVPLSHLNVSTSAFNIAESLKLDQSDVGLNIMPLFHIHGLIAAILSSMARGACVYCTPGFDALKFYAWLEDCAPTWYTAVPTMHQAILARAPRNADVVAQSRLRFIRSSSSSLPPTVMKELNRTFGCPVVEAYGMTEAAHQMACNPIGPGMQLPGSVGLPAGPRIAILSDTGLTTDKETVGEIVISGQNVTAGYDGNEKANAESFLVDETDGSTWFRTGDQGWLDADGYLFISGRLKEIINRGGEKVSPREVDEVLMNHPAVSQAVTFALSHPKLGEDVAAAIVLKEGSDIDETILRSFAAQFIAAFKVPRKIVFVDEIPKGPTGKLQRIGLAKTLGLEAAE